MLVLALWTVGQIIDWAPKGDPRVIVRSLHILFGLVLGLTIVLRLVWRLRGGAQLAPAEPGIKGHLAVGVHRVLYVLLISIVLVGIASVWVRGDNIFGLFTVPAFDPANRALRHNIVEFHGLLANILLVVSALHAAMALLHHAVLKDGVLARMVPKLLRKPQS